ncbi:MAG: hypothetical protein F7B59_02020 [Desulfurococcales archaeon]|nr:hypothetical protein [Desulfurococcales archaeon]
MGYNKVGVRIIYMDNTVRVSVPGGMEAVIPRSSLCKFFKRYNLEANGVKC